MRNMGGLKQYMPITWVPDVDRDAGDRRHSAVLRILLEGRDPRRGVRARARIRRSPTRRCSASRAARCCTSSTCSASPRRSHRDLHDADDALHLPRPEPHRRARSSEHLHEAPWVMTGPLVVLGVLERRRRLAQPAERSHSDRPRRRARALARAGGRRGDACASTGGARTSRRTAPSDALDRRRGR